MFHRIYAIALNTFREAIRNKMLYGIMLMVVGMNFFALVLGQMSLHQEARVARDVGVAGVSLFGAVTAIILGVSMLYAEIQKKTIHNILSKPMERYEFVIGKYAGMGITLTILVVLFALAMGAMLAMASAMTPYADVEFSSALLKAVVLGYFEVLVVAAIAIFFSSFSTPFLAGIFTFAVFFLGRSAEELRAAAAGAKATGLQEIASIAQHILPDLYVFSISGAVIDGNHMSVHGEFVSWAYVGNAFLSAGGWIVALLCLAVASFHRRDFI